MNFILGVLRPLMFFWNNDCELVVLQSRGKPAVGRIACFQCHLHVMLEFSQSTWDVMGSEVSNPLKDQSCILLLIGSNKAVDLYLEEYHIGDKYLLETFLHFLYLGWAKNNFTFLLEKFCTASFFKLMD